MMTYVLEDLEGSMEALLFPKMYEKYGELMKEDEVVRVRARVDLEDRGQAKLITEEVQTIDTSPTPRTVVGAPSPISDTATTDSGAPRRLDLAIDDSMLGNGGSERLRDILAKHPGAT